MALIDCKECKKAISNTAKFCPDCGWKVEKLTPSPLAGLILLVLAAMMFKSVAKYIPYLIGVKRLSSIDSQHIRYQIWGWRITFIVVGFFIYSIYPSNQQYRDQNSTNATKDIIEDPIVFSERDKNSFKLFKNNKILLGKRLFSDILNKNSQTLSHSLSDFEDSIIIVEPSNNYKYRYFIGAGSRFKVISWSEEERNWLKSQEKITEGIVDLTMNHDDFIYYNENQIKHEAIVNANISGSQYEVYPQDIRCELSHLGVIIMQNSIVNFIFNSSEEYFIDTTTFLNFFPDSDLVRSIERDIVNLTEFLEAEGCGIGVVVVDSFESQITDNENELYLYKNILDNPVIKDNAKQFILESIENGIIIEEDIIKLISENKERKIKKIHVKRLIRSKNKEKNE